MNILAISGSARAASTNTALLQALASHSPMGVRMEVFRHLADLPVFSPDLEGPLTPKPVRAFVQQVQAADGLLICSPEYVRAIPGGLKNAIDWLVSGEQIVHKPIALVHASHRGEDMLTALRLVLSTVSSRFNSELFLRVPVMKETADAIHASVNRPEVLPIVTRFLLEFSDYCRASTAD